MWNENDRGAHIGEPSQQGLRETTKNSVRIIILPAENCGSLNIKCYRMGNLAMNVSNMKVYPMRLPPGTEIKSSLLEFVRSNQLNAAFILSCCGSVRKATLRFATSADQTHQVCILDKNFEITSLVGTICKDGAHLHVTLGDSDGNTVAGHVFGDLIVETTAEVILGEVCGLQFKREFDEATGYSELVISKHEEMK